MGVKIKWNFRDKNTILALVIKGCCIWMREGMGYGQVESWKRESVGV